MAELLLTRPHDVCDTFSIATVLESSHNEA